MNVPDYTYYDSTIGAWMHTGSDVDAVIHTMPAGLMVAADIETPGLHDPFTIKCITFAWEESDGVHGVLLDPARDETDHALARHVIEKAGYLVFHNDAFDMPGMVTSKLITVDEIDKTLDTLVYARMALPDTLDSKTLEALAARYLGMSELSGGLAMAIKAHGLKSKAEWFQHADIDVPTYRFGAMADTVVTLRLLPEIVEAVVDHLTDHPFDNHGITDREDALELAAREQRVNQIMLKRSCRGLAVDLEYMDRYRDSVEGEIARASLVLTGAGIEPGKGEQLVAYLDSIGDLPEGWPRTAKTRKPSSAKDHLESLGHPLADAHRVVAANEKIIGYLDAVHSRSRVTGRLHPQVGILAASTTGRMSYNSPALQQFSKDARPIITDDGQGLTSVDWSQIEPVTMANMAGDQEFLDPFEAGADLYEPIQRAAGIDRSTAKVVLLATMYGQGDKALAAKINHALPKAMQIKRQMLAAMPESAKFMGKIATIASQYGKVVTISGRILTVPSYRGEYIAYPAVNYVIQGSAYDILSESIIRIDKAGLADHIQLALHDELVVDTPAAEEIEQLMLTPPDSLVYWSQPHTPVLRCDRQSMSHHWAKV